MHLLTDKQQNVLDQIKNYIEMNLKSPTIDELQKLIYQKSKRWVVQYLEALEKKGFIRKKSWFRWIILNGYEAKSVWFFDIPVINDKNKLISVSREIVWDLESKFFFKYSYGEQLWQKVNWKILQSWSLILLTYDEKYHWKILPDNWKIPWKIVDIFNLYGE